jgi:dienelactone hydrolase
MLAAGPAGAAPPAIMADGPPLPGTARLEMEGDIASQLVAGADRFLLEQISQSVAGRARFWHRDLSSPEKYNRSIEPNRQRLAHILGLRDPRVPSEGLEMTELTGRPALVGQSDRLRVFAVRWPAFGDVHGVGLLLVPTGRAVADVIAIPDADQPPELLAGLVEGLAPESQFARRLAENGCRVLVPVLIDRSMRVERGTKMTSREYIYRSAFELGRHLLGYELQKVLAAVDFFAQEGKRGQAPFAGTARRVLRTNGACPLFPTSDENRDSRRVAQRPARIGLVGWGEGGLLALEAGALDQRIAAVCVSGYFTARENVWQEPLEHNVWGLLEQFGDAELAAMIAPRTLIVEAARAPQVVIPAGLGGGPGRIATPAADDVRRELDRAGQLVAGLQPAPHFELIVSGDGSGPYGSPPALQALLGALSADAKLVPPGPAPKPIPNLQSLIPSRQQAQFHELKRHNQWLLDGCAETRRKFFERLDTSSLAKFRGTIEPYRTFFYDEVIGRFDLPLRPPRVRTRKTYDEPKWTGYEVVLDVFPEVIAYGILLLPKDLRPGQRRPVVVCQHGLEGRPQDVIAGGNPAYAQFASALAEQGFVTFAPQNLYLFQDRFRSLQRKANPLKKSLFSIIVPQHQQIVDWLATLPFVDRERIAFYGLSYGGKSAMRIPPLVRNYCLSICSADFNEWVWKNASVGNPYTYVGTGEYEIFEFDLGSTFNYAEMAALIAPRPFMVERGHFDGVAPDETVAYEFAKVRFLYEARLGIGDRCELEFFNGPHMIHGQGTYRFLHKHLNWP